MLFCALVMSAQWQMDEGAAAALRQDLTRAGNNTNSYEFNTLVDSKAPAGFKPVYVAHYGRHGSRSNWGDASYKRVISALTKAKEEGILKPVGDDVIAEASAVLANYNGMDGRLTQRGVREHAKIADRLYDRVPAVFKGKKTVRTVSSTTPRCIISMCGFTNELARRNPKLTILPDTGEKIMAYITDPGTGIKNEAEITAKLNAEFDSRAEDTLAILNTLFTDPEKGHAIVGNVVKFHDDLYSVAQIAEDFDLEEIIYPLMPFESVYKRWSYWNKYLYYHNGNSAEFGTKRVPCSESLVNDFITKADDALSRDDIAADLRFGHDYPVFSFASYIGLEGVGERLAWDDVDAFWWGWRDLCMASNVQFIFYRNKAGETIVKFIYNGVERKLRGLEPDYAPCFYKWETFKANSKGYLR